METTMIDKANICGTAEVATVLGCPKQQIHALRKTANFPQPFVILAATPLWSLPEILAFKESWKRRGKRTAPAMSEALAS